MNAPRGQGVFEKGILIFLDPAEVLSVHGFQKKNIQR